MMEWALHTMVTICELSGCTSEARGEVKGKLKRVEEGNVRKRQLKTRLAGLWWYS